MNSPHSKSNWFAILLALGLGLACFVLVVALYRSRAELAETRAEAATLRVQVDAARAKAAFAPTEASGRRPASEAPATPPPAEGVSQDATAEDVAAGANRDRQRVLNADEMAAMMKSPVMQQIMASQTSTVTRLTYGHLMDHLQLTPEERDYLQTLLVEKQTNLQNLGMQLMNPGLSADDRNTLMQQLSEAWVGGEAKIREFLNDDSDYAYYQSYSQQEPERKEVGMFEASLPDGDSLDPATSDSLATLQNEARRNFPFTVDFYDQANFGNPAVLNTASVQRFLDEQSRFQSHVADEAAHLLTPSHLAIFKQNQAAVRRMTSMQLNSIVQLAGGGQ